MVSSLPVIWYPFCCKANARLCMALPPMAIKCMFINLSFSQSAKDAKLSVLENVKIQNNQVKFQDNYYIKIGICNLRFVILTLLNQMDILLLNK